VASLSQGRTAAAQCGLFTYKSVPVIFEPPCINAIRSPDDEHCDARNIYRDEINKYIKKRVKFVISKNLQRDVRSTKYKTLNNSWINCV